MPHPSLAWTRTYNAAADGDDRIYGVAIDPAGGFAVAGAETAVASHSEDWLVRKYGANGEIAWSDHYNSKADEADVALAVVVDASGDVLACGYEVRPDLGSGEDANALVRRYGPAGSLLWSTSYNDPAGGYDTARGIAVDPSGNVIVAGDSDAGALLVKYDPSGNPLWATVFHGSFGAGDSFNAVACDPAGNIIVAGYTDYGLLDSDWVVCKYSPGGVQQWAFTVPEGNSADDVALGVAVDADGNAYVAGYTNRLIMTQNADWALRKYSPSGNLLWQRFYDGPSHSADYANAVAVDSFGGAVVVGDSEGSLMARKYTPDGEIAWVAGHSNSKSDLDTPNSVAIRGPFIAVGGGELRTDLGQDFNWLLLRYRYYLDARLAGSEAHPGGRFTVVLSVTNVGDAVMKAVSASLTAPSGASLATPVSGPSGPADLAAGASRFFTWTFLANGVGTVSFLAGVSGTEFGTGATAYESASVSVPITASPAATLWLDGPGAALDRNIFRPGAGERLLVRIFPREAGDISVKVFTASGMLVRTLPKAVDSIGGGQFVMGWDGKNGSGDLVHRGVYLVAVEGGGLKKVLKVVVR
jgi:uncharacterized delta-60 repeat protein